MILFLCALGCFLGTKIQAEAKENVLNKQDSPTPWIRDRCSDFLTRMPHNAVVIEVGVERGAYAELILKRTNPRQLYLIDPWCYQNPEIYNDPLNVSDTEQEEAFLETSKRFVSTPNVFIIRDFSKNAVEQFADESIDWIYLDGNHGYEAIKEDLSIWWPKIKKGGILSGHDYAAVPSFGVVQAVNEFLLDHNLEFHTLTVGIDQYDIYDSWAIEKPIN